MPILDWDKVVDKSKVQKFNHMIRPKYRPSGAATPSLAMQKLPKSLRFSGKTDLINVPAIRQNIRISKVDH